MPVNRHRAFVFPNRMRELRRVRGYAKLLPFAGRLPDIPYIRLSKIERGEVVARVEELRAIAAALGVEPEALLIDIDAPDFDLAVWAEPFVEADAGDIEEERFAVLLGAALRARRIADAELSIAAIERDYGLPPVNLSRVENAQRQLARWNAATRASLLRLFNVADEAGLRAEVARMHASGLLDGFIHTIGAPEVHRERTRARIAELRAALRDGTSAPLAPVLATGRTLPVLGMPIGRGLIAPAPTGTSVETPAIAGPRAFALRVCRATLGGGLPAQAVAIVDPDRYPAPGGLAALREGEAWRVLGTAAERDGRLTGYSVNPAFEIVLDDCDPADVAAIVSAVFV